MGLLSSTPTVSGPMDHSAYIWQRAWNVQLKTAALNASEQVGGFVLLGGEIGFSGDKIKYVSVAIDHKTVGELTKPVGIALRIGACPGGFSRGGDKAKRISEIAGSLLTKAKSKGLQVSEFQIDYDCPESKLKSYCHLIESLRNVTGDVRLTITALPSWLNNKSFKRLAKLTDGYVLQVHSLERPKTIDEPMVLCDSHASLKWVEKAGRIGVAFKVALPTYGYLVAFDKDGKFKGLVAEGPGRDFGDDVRLVKVSSDPKEMFKLVSEWTKKRPECMEGIIWYRLPVQGDELNWSWLTLSTIISGKAPVDSLQVEIAYPRRGLAEIFLVNDGQTEQRADLLIIVECPQRNIVASDAMRGYSITIKTANEFVMEHDGTREFSAIKPGEKHKIGWIFFEQDMEIRTHVKKP